MIYIAVCEDDEADKELFKLHISQVVRSMLLECQVDYMRSGKALIKAIEAGAHYDLLILDIIMEGMSGIETAKAASRRLPGVFIGFMTNSDAFMLEAFELDALHYLLKPVTEDNVRKLFLRYQKRADKEVEVVEFETAQGKLAFPTNMIFKIESYKKGVAIYLQGQSKPQQIHQTFMSVEEMLDKKIFIRIARGLVVNMEYIERMEGGVCYFFDGTSALISRRERTVVRNCYNDYLFGRMKVLREKLENA